MSEISLSLRQSVGIWWRITYQMFFAYLGISIVLIYWSYLYSPSSTFILTGIYGGFSTSASSIPRLFEVILELSAATLIVKEAINRDYAHIRLSVRSLENNEEVEIGFLNAIRPMWSIFWPAVLITVILTSVFFFLISTSTIFIARLFTHYTFFLSFPSDEGILVAGSFYRLVSFTLVMLLALFSLRRAINKNYRSFRLSAVNKFSTEPFTVLVNNVGTIQTTIPVPVKKSRLKKLLIALTFLVGLAGVAILTIEYFTNLTFFGDSTMADPDRRREIESQSVVGHLKEKQRAGVAFDRDDLLALYGLLDADVTSYRSSIYNSDLHKMREGRDVRADLSVALGIPRERISLTKEDALAGAKDFHYRDLDLSDLDSTQSLVLPKKVFGTLRLKELGSPKDIIFPEEIVGDFYIEELLSVEGVVWPRKIGGRFILKNIQSSKGLTLPREIGSDIELGVTSVDDLTFPDITATIRLGKLETSSGLILPRVLGGDLYLNSLKSAEGIVFPQVYDPSFSKYWVSGAVFLDSIRSAKGIIFPKGIRKVSLRSLTSAEDLVLPVGVEEVDLNGLLSAKGLVLPNGAREVNLSGLTSTKGLILPEGISKLRLDGLTTLDGFIFPLSTGTVYLDKFSDDEKMKLNEQYGHRTYFR